MNVVFRFGRFRLNPATRTLLKDGSDVVVGSRAFDILVALVEADGDVLSRRQLMARAWSGLVVEESNVRVQVAHLRKCLGCGQGGARFIASVAGRGYCFVAEVTREQESQPASSTTILASTPATTEPLDLRWLANAPVIPQPVIGREESVAELAGHVSQRRLVTVVGAAGMGKTTVAVLAARSMAQNACAIHFIDLSLVAREEQVLEAMAAAVDYRPSGSVEVSGLAEFLNARRSLLILDNCEHVIDQAASLCKQLLAQTRRISILCTSREALRLSEEHVYLLPPLGSPPNTGKLLADRVRTWAAVQLFVERAEEAGALNVLSDESASLVAAICRRLDGNPLAIELVASRVSTYGVQGVSDLLASQSALHWQGRRDVSPRHRTVEALLDWTFDLLPPRDQLTLCRLSVFSGGFPLESAISVISDDALDSVQAAAGIADLADKSLISVRTKNGRARLRLLETTRAYAAAKLDAADAKALARRHASHYAELLRSSDAPKRLDPSASPQVRGDELGNVRLALERCFEIGADVDMGVDLSVLAVPSFVQHRSFGEAARCAKRALDAIPPALRFSSAELTLLEALTIAQASMGAYGDDMMLTLQRGLEVSQRLGDDRTSMHLSAGLHLVLLGTGRFAESLRVAEQYAVLAKNRGGASERVIAHWMIGASHHYMGEHIRADAEFAAARRGLAQSSLRKLQYFDSKALLNANLGMARTKLALGCPSQALQLAVKAIEEAREYPDSLFPCVTLFLPIFLLHDLDSVAAKLIESLEQVSPEYRVGFRLKNIEMMKGLLLAQRGDHVEAELRLRGCIDGVRMTVSRFIALQALSDVLRVNGKPAEAFACIEEAIALSESSGGRYAYPDLLRTKAEVMMDLPQFSTSQVRGLLVEAAEDARESGALGWEVAIATTLARFERANERSHEATSMLQEVYSRFSEGHETRLLRQAMATLSTA